MDQEKMPDFIKKRIHEQMLLRSAFNDDLHEAYHVLIYALQQASSTVDKVQREEILNGVVAGIFQMGYEASEDQQRQGENCEFENDEQELKTLDNMEAHAGSFVKYLASFYRLADPFNKRKLRYNFWKYFQEYLTK